ncbi:hypothetical protein C1646_755849 [Rhizophagus diaphanus]|nr:hypothetical protein C1646_755849 [Rhizophagus diaphanus] [Rhizophagus sp. MUCL 43196]
MGGHCDDPNPSIDGYPVFSCGNADLKGGKSRAFIGRIERNLLILTVILLAGVSFYEDNFKIIPEKLKSRNGQGNLDYVIECGKILDGEQDVDKVFGIVTDAREWYFMECTLEREGKPSFKLSEPVSRAKAENAKLKHALKFSIQGKISNELDEKKFQKQCQSITSLKQLGLKSGEEFCNKVKLPFTGDQSDFQNICIRRQSRVHYVEKGLQHLYDRHKTDWRFNRDDNWNGQNRSSIHITSDDEDQNPSPLLTSSQFKCFAESLLHSWIIDLNDREAEAQFTVEEWKEIRCEIRKLPEIDESFVVSMMRFADRQKIFNILLKTIIETAVGKSDASKDIFITLLWSSVDVPSYECY